MFISNNLGSTLRTARMQKNMTQEEVAELVGVCVETIRNIETGKTKPSYDVLLRLWDTYRLPMKMLRLYKNPPAKKQTHGDHKNKEGSMICVNKIRSE